MAEFPALPLWTDAYLADTRHLSTIEHGAYLLLLMAMWRNGGDLPDDDMKIRKITGLTKAQWARSNATIYEFLAVKDGRISQPRLTDEINYVRTKSKKAADSARAKWRKHKERGDANASSEQCESDAPTPTPTPIEKPLHPAGAPPLEIPIGNLFQIRCDQSWAEPTCKPAEPKPPPPKRGTRLPDGWTLPDYWRQAAADARGRHGLPPIDLDLTAELFANYWQGKGGQAGTKRDWRKTWINWCLNENQRGKAHGGKPAGRENGWTGLLLETTGRATG